MAFQGKLTLRAATTISLHERFTHLKSIKPIPARGPEHQTRAQIPKQRPPSPEIYYVAPPPTSHRRANSAPKYHGIFEEDLPRYHRQPNSAVRQPRYLQRNPRPIRPDLAFAAAMKLKQRSIKQRLGQRERHEQPLYYNHQNSQYRRFYNGYRERRGGYRGHNRSMNRWESNQSLASDGMGRNRRRSGNWWGRGGGASNGYGRDYQRSGNWWGRGGRGRRGRGGGRGGRYQKPKISKEELDAQLDSYMANTKTVLDKDLNDYMSQKA